MQLNYERFKGFELPGKSGGSLLVPQAYFERVLLTEPASVSRLVWYFLSRSMAELEKGACIEEITITASYSELESALHLAHSSVAEGMRRALDAGYLRLVHSGENGHSRSRYAINWQSGTIGDPEPAGPGGKGPGRHAKSGSSGNVAASGKVRGSSPEAGEAGAAASPLHPYGFHTTTSTPAPGTSPESQSRSYNRVTGEEPHWHSTEKPTASGAASAAGDKDYRAGKETSGETSSESEKKTGSAGRSPDSIKHDSNSTDSNYPCKSSLFSRRVESGIEPLFLPSLPVCKAVGQEQSASEPESGPAGSSDGGDSLPLPSQPSSSLPHISLHVRQSESPASPEKRGGCSACTPGRQSSRPSGDRARSRTEEKGGKSMPGAGEGAETVKRKVRLPAPLTSLNRAFSFELGDKAHTPSNHAQTRNLWQASGLEVTEFAEVMYQARELTRRYATLRPGEVMRQGQTRNRMPYFFATLRDLLEGNDHESGEAWNGEVREGQHVTGEEQPVCAGGSSLSGYPVVDISVRREVPAQAVKWVNKGSLTSPYTNSSHQPYNRPSHKEKTHAKQSFDSGRSSEHGQNRIYDSWLVAAGLKKNSESSTRLAVRG